MTEYTFTAGNVLALYLWHMAKTELGWSENDYGGLVPVVPVQQQPELNSVTGPFVIFGQAFDAVSPMHMLQTETVAFTVFSHNISDINKLTNLMVFNLKGYDESAERVNHWVSTLSASHPARYFDFKIIRVAGASGPQPSLQEGGRHDGNIVLKATYAHYGDDGEEVRDEPLWVAQPGYVYIPKPVVGPKPPIMYK